MNAPSTPSIRGVAVLKGGISGERDVSLQSGAAVEEALRQLGYTPGAFDVNDRRLPIDELAKFDVVFIALHGTFGEDGGVQEQLERAGIAYTGSDSATSRLAMDKLESKHVFIACKIPTPRYHVLDNTQIMQDLHNYAVDLGFPVVTKPNNEGSSLGVSIVREEAQLHQAVRAALKFNNLALMEEHIPGKQLEVSILDGQALPMIEVIPNSEFFDYHAKYEAEDTRFEFDTGLSPERYQLAQETALRAYKVLNCRDFSRVDLILNDAGVPYVLEVNTIPGLTSHSLLPKSAAKAGIPFPQLIQRMLQAAAMRKTAF